MSLFERRRDDNIIFVFGSGLRTRVRREEARPKLLLFSWIIPENLQISLSEKLALSCRLLLLKEGPEGPKREVAYYSRGRPTNNIVESLAFMEYLDMFDAAVVMLSSTDSGQQVRPWLPQHPRTSIEGPCHRSWILRES